MQEGGGQIKTLEAACFDFDRTKHTLQRTNNNVNLVVLDCLNLCTRYVADYGQSQATSNQPSIPAVRTNFHASSDLIFSISLSSTIYRSSPPLDCFGANSFFYLVQTLVFWADSILKTIIFSDGSENPMTEQKGKEGIKVVIINTQYVQTDPKSFKSVVQQLTGKDSKVTGSPDAQNCTAGTGGAQSGTGDCGGMSRNLSFKYDLDRMLKEMPPVGEFNDLWSN